MSNVESFRLRQDSKRDVLDFPPGNTFARLIVVKAIAQLRRSTPATEAARLWPADLLVQRAASAPATTTTSGWASDLAHKIVKDALDVMGPAAGGAQLLKQSVVLTFDGNGQISAPGLVAGAGNAGFVAEGSPIPVRQLATTTALLQPFKLAVIGVLSQEMIDSSNAETLIADVLLRSAAAALDAQLFGSAAATSAAPAGIRNGISTTTPSAVTDLWEAVFEDVSNLITAVSAVGGSGPYALIANAGRAAMIRARFTVNWQDFPILQSAAAGNDLICVAPAALVCALSPDPTIEMANAAELHMNDTPQAIANGGTATPTRSLFQTYAVALKMRWPVTWALRDARGVAWTTPTWK